MFKNHLKRLVSIALCIACLIPAITSFAAEMCPGCGKGRLNPGQITKKTARYIDKTYHGVEVTRQYKCGNCGYSITRTTTTRQQHSMSDWKPDGSVERTQHVEVSAHTDQYISEVARNENAEAQ